MYKLTDTVKHLLIINVLMFIGTMAFQGTGLFYKLFALYFPKSDMFEPWQVFTHMFMHGGLMHIFFNMFALWMFGIVVEQQLGSRKFIFFYISCGLGAALVQLGFYYFQFYSELQHISHLGLSNDLINQIVNIDSRQGDVLRGDLFETGLRKVLSSNAYGGPMIDQSAFEVLFNLNAINHASMVGASGAIMGVLVAFGMMNPEARLMLILLPIPVKAKYFIPAIIGLDLISALTGHSIFSPSNTAYAAHVGGALTGFLIMWVWKRNQFNKNRWYL